MKKEMKPKKLTLSRETLRSLDDEQVREAAGGLLQENQKRDIPWTSNSVNICCA